MKINVVELRAIVSTALIVIFLITAVTGLVLAEDEDFFIEHSLLKDLHTYAGYTLIGLVAVHLLLNFRMYLAELKTILR